MNYSQLKKLDEDTLEKLTDGLGPSDECICHLLAPPVDEGEKRGLKQSIKRAFASFSQARDKGGKGRKQGGAGVTSVDIPLTFSKGGKGIYSSKEAVKRSSPCGKCGCDNENIFLKHSYANIRISAPDVSSFCSCPSNCLSDNEKFKNNIKVTIERLSVPSVRQTDAEGPDVELPARNRSADTVSHDQSVKNLEEDQE